MIMQNINITQVVGKVAALRTDHDAILQLANEMVPGEDDAFIKDRLLAAVDHIGEDIDDMYEPAGALQLGDLEAAEKLTYQSRIFL